MESCVTDEFEGWDGETYVVLDNGTAWKQAEYYYEYCYLYRPRVTITNGVMSVEGMDKKMPVHQVSFVESRISGEFKGWEGSTKFELENGQVWEQVRYKYKYKYKYRPHVWIFENRYLKVDCLSETIEVRRVK